MCQNMLSGYGVTDPIKEEMGEENVRQIGELLRQKNLKYLPLIQLESLSKDFNLSFASKCVCIPCVHAVPVDTRRGHWILETGVRDGCEQLYG